MSSASLYTLLGARREATPDELKHDYERTLAEAHRSGATKRMVELVKAYEVLSDPHRRAYYDETGRAVHRERVPNTFGRQVPFRAMAPALGQESFNCARDVVPNACRPASERPGLSSNRGLRWAVALLVGFGMASGAVALLRQGGAQPTPTTRYLVPGDTGTQVDVVCRTAHFWAESGRVITCADGSVPAFGATRVVRA